MGLEFSGHILAVLPALVIGLVAGGTAVVFTAANLKINALREALTPRGGPPWRRMIEPCVLALLFTTGSMLLPRASPCTPTECVTFQGQVYCAGGANQTIIDDQGVPMVPPMNLPLYTCAVPAAGAANGTWVPDGGTLTPDSSGGNGTTAVYYNQLATLLFTPGASACARALRARSPAVGGLPAAGILRLASPSPSPPANPGSISHPFKTVICRRRPPQARTASST